MAAGTVTGTRQGREAVAPVSIAPPAPLATLRIVRDGKAPPIAVALLQPDAKGQYA